MALGQATEMFEARHGLSHQLPFPRLCLVIARSGSSCGAVVQGRAGAGDLPQLQVIPPAPLPCFSNPFHLKVAASLLN